MKKLLGKLVSLSTAAAIMLTAAFSANITASAESVIIADKSGADLTSAIVQTNSYADQDGANVNVEGSAVTTAKGIGGKAADDISALGLVPALPTTSDDYKRTNNHKQHLFFNYNEASVGNKYIVAEVNFFPVNGYSFGTIAMQPNVGVFITPTVNEKDGKVRIGSWNNIRFVTQPSTASKDNGLALTQVYINGALVKDGRAFAGYNEAYVYPHRLMFDCGSFGAFDQKLYLDDFKVYITDENPGAPSIPTVVPGDGYTVNDDFTITVAGDTKLSALSAAFGTVSAYSDDSFSFALTADSVLADGAKIVVSDGAYMSTYTVTAPIDGDIVYRTKFSNSVVDSGLTLANGGYYTAEFPSHIGGKTTADISLNFKRAESLDNTSGFNGNNIYTYVLAPANRQYIKYEVNFMPGSADFKEVKFTTQGHNAISPVLACTDDGAAVTNALERYQWNKIVYIIRNNSIPANTSENEMSFSVDLYVNGKEICKNTAFTGKKNGNVTSSALTPIRFAVYGKDVNKGNGTTLYAAINSYIDDITVTAHDEYPAVASMPHLMSDGEATAINGNILNVYERTTVGDLKCSDGAIITVFDTETYDYYMVDENPLYDGNLIIVSDDKNNMSYYTVRKNIRNDATIIGDAGKVTARANLKGAVLVLAEYDEDGNMLRVDYSALQGETSVTLRGEFALAKAMVIGNALRPMCEAKTYVSKPSIACWGASITRGQGSSNEEQTSYPAVLGRLTGLDSYNMGVGGETQTTIAARQGGYIIKLDGDVTIPADTVPVEIKFSAYDKDGNYAGVVTPRNASLAGWNPCVINGVEGTLGIEVNNSVWPRVLNRAKFTRKTAGEAVSAAKGDRLIVDANNLKADINVMAVSSNGGWGPSNKTANDADSADLINTLDNMIANFKYPDKFVVIGVTTGGTGAWAQTDAALKAKYGEHFLDVKGYLTNADFLTENGVALTDNDNKYLAQGKIPPSLLNNSPTDDVHMNDTGYALFAKCLYEKMQVLGYVE